MDEQFPIKEENCHERAEYEHTRSQHLDDTCCDHSQGDVSEDLLGHVQPGGDRKLILVHLWGFVFLLHSCNGRDYYCTILNFSLIQFLLKVVLSSRLNVIHGESHHVSEGVEEGLEERVMEIVAIDTNGCVLELDQY